MMFFCRALLSGREAGPGSEIGHVGGLGCDFFLIKDRRSVILGVWAAPGAPEPLPKGGGLRPPPLAGVSEAPKAAQSPKITDFLSLQCFRIV
jgi:hypothetical protein